MRTSPSDDLQRSVLLLNHRGSALHPIAVVHVQDGSDHAIIGAMNVSADHTVGFVFAGGCKHCSISEVGKELKGPARWVAEIVGKRSSFSSVPFRLPMVPVMDSLCARVRVSSYHRDQTIWIERPIELMPMDHKHPRTVDGCVDQGAPAQQRAEKFLNQADVELVVITRDEYYFGATMPPSHDLID
jgi:hypothetical protein